MSATFSRRRMILAGGAAFIASTVVKAAKGPDPVSTSLTAPDRELFTLSGTEPKFGAAVEALYPGLQADIYFRLIAPLAILITHRRGPGVRAFSVSWSVTTANGTSTTPLFYYHAPGSAKKHKSTSTLGSARRDIFQAGAAVLVTPFFAWTPNFYQNGPEPDWTKLMSGVKPGDFLVSQLNSATAVNAILDCAIFSDWKKMGPNQHHFARRLIMRRNAEHDEGLAVHRMLKSGATDNMIIETLTRHANAPISKALRPAKRHYDQCRRFQAQVLLRHYQGSDRAVFIKALHRLVTQKMTKIPKSIA